MRRNREEEARRWLIHALDGFKDADELRKRGRHYLALFHYQQSAEKALKAFLYSRTAALEVLYTRSVDELVGMAVESDADSKALEKSKKLDQYYISTRYPNGLPGGVPSRFYDDPGETEAAMELARRVIDLVAANVPLSG
jgi:HEPN domain-containing protein